MTSAFLVPARADPPSRTPLGVVLRRVALWDDLAFAGAAWRVCGARTAFLGGAASTRPSTRFQIQAAAVLGLRNPLTGVTPGRPFQMATRRWTGHLAASSPNSAAVLNRSAPATASASWADPCAVMLFSESIVKFARKVDQIILALRVGDVGRNGPARVLSTDTT